MELLLSSQVSWSFFGLVHYLTNLKQVKGEELADDDPQMSYMISAWARICKILGAGFAPYLPMVMAPVMKTASMKPEVALLDNDEVEGVGEDSDDWQFVNLGEQQNFGIKTAGLEDKATACQMLVCYARELKEHFADYTEQVSLSELCHLQTWFLWGVTLPVLGSTDVLTASFIIDCKSHINSSGNKF